MYPATLDGNATGNESALTTILPIPFYRFWGILCSEQFLSRFFSGHYALAARCTVVSFLVIGRFQAGNKNYFEGVKSLPSRDVMALQKRVTHKYTARHAERLGSMFLYGAMKVVPRVLPLVNVMLPACLKAPFCLADVPLAILFVSDYVDDIVFVHNSPLSTALLSNAFEVVGRPGCKLRVPSNSPI